MNICFFDIDGVLNKKEDWTTLYSLDDKLIKIFCNILKDCKLTPVLTSSWRTGFVSPSSKKNTPNIQKLEEKLQKYGIKIYEKTPSLKGQSRDKEIERFLYYHENEVENYIIIDDDKTEFNKISEHNYFTDYKTGITKKDYDKIKKLIKKW